jgi:hypothetical protein
MARYHLHFTDGVDFVLDRTGTEIPDDESAQRLAFGSALGLMRSLPNYRDWRQWVVAVHDEDGYQVDVVPFPDQRVFTELLWQTVCSSSGVKRASASSRSPHLRV